MTVDGGAAPDDPFSGGLRITITTPPLWWDLPLHSPDRLRDIERLVAERSTGLGESVDRAAVAASLEQTAAHATALGAVFASQFGVADTDVEFGAGIIVAVHRHMPEEQPGGEVGTVATANLGPVTRRLLRVPLGADGRSACLAQNLVPVPDSDLTVLISGSCVGSDDLASVGEMFDRIVDTVVIERDQLGS